MKVGIVGFAGCGKTSVFELLTGVEHDPAAGLKGQVGVARIHDPRLAFLRDLLAPKKCTEATIEFVDTLGLLPDNQRVNPHRLALLREGDGLVVVLETFAGGDPNALWERFSEELLFADLEITSGRRDRLVHDLASFFCETHSVPLEVACGWLGIPFEGKETASRMAALFQRNHAWFGPDAVAEMRPALEPRFGLDEDEARLFEETNRLFQAREVSPGDMVFCHGDIHGYNVAMGEDELGARIVGVFDLGCAWILDIHEDFFRLSLVSEDLVERVMAAYQALPGHRHTLDRDRIATFYRAFLFHLMVGKTGERLAHLKRLLQKHLVYYTV